MPWETAALVGPREHRGGSGARKGGDLKADLESEEPALTRKGRRSCRSRRPHGLCAYARPKRTDGLGSRCPQPDALGVSRCQASGTLRWVESAGGKHPRALPHAPPGASAQPPLRDPTSLGPKSPSRRLPRLNFPPGATAPGSCARTVWRVCALAVIKGRDRCVLRGAVPRRVSGCGLGGGLCHRRGSQERMLSRGVGGRAVTPRSRERRGKGPSGEGRAMLACCLRRVGGF